MAAKKKSSAKQASPASDKHLYKLHGLLLPKAQHREIRRFKRLYDEPSLHGTKVWRSSAVLMDYLLENPIKKGAKVVEIGCGWGGLSCFMASHFKARVMALDADAALRPTLSLSSSLTMLNVWNFRRSDLKKSPNGICKAFTPW